MDAGGFGGKRYGRSFGEKIRREDCVLVPTNVDDHMILAGRCFTVRSTDHDDVRVEVSRVDLTDLPPRGDHHVTLSD